MSWSDFSRNNIVESWADFGRNINRFNQAYIEEVCTNEGEGSGEFNMEQTEETHSPQNTTITEQREHKQNQAPVTNPYAQRTEMMCTTGSKPKFETTLGAKLKSIKTKFKRNATETNWHNRTLIKEFSTLGPRKLHKIIGTASTKEIDLVTTDRSTWYKHKMSIEGGTWSEI